MTGAPATLVTPPGRWRVLAAGLANATRRPGAHPVLPDETLALPDCAIEAAQVRAYAALCGFATDHGVPLVFPHMLAFPLHMALMMRRGFPFPMAGTVHVANRIEQLAPLAIGDRLAIVARCGGLLSHPRGQAFTIEVAITRGGEPVWQSSSMYLHRGVPGIGPALPPLPEPDAPIERWRGHVPRSIGRDYARVSSDRNPIHTSAIGARLFGFPRPIAHGMWSLARVVAVLTPVPPAGRAVVDAAFRAPLLLPGEVVLRADAVGRFLLADASNGRVHLSGALTC